MAFLQTYALPLAGALLLHALVAFFFSQGVTSQNDDIAQVITPTVVNAKLMVVEAPAVKKPAPKPARKAPPVKSSVPKPVVVKTKPAQESKPQLKATQVDTAEAERQRKALADQRRRERLAALGELADDSLQRSLDAEAEQMLEGQNLQEVQSYQAGIYDLVRKNWSRPPSARNGMQARFVVELIPTGEVLSVALVDSSGNGSFDRSAEQAIRRARRFDVPEDNGLFEANFRRFYFLFRPEDLLR
jgi:colicin import membrane protein